MSFNFKSTLAGLVLGTMSAVLIHAADVTLKLAGTLPEAHHSNPIL